MGLKESTFIGDNAFRFELVMLRQEQYFCCCVLSSCYLDMKNQTSLKKGYQTWHILRISLDVMSILELGNCDLCHSQVGRYDIQIDNSWIKSSCQI